MTANIFDTNYSDQYDLLYGEKDYEAECDVLEKVFRKDFDGRVQTILDLGCGTGNHVIPLSRRGYQVTGVDISQDMLAHARTKAEKLMLQAGAEVKEPIFYQNNLRNFNVEMKYDIVLMMFAVLGYQLKNDQVMDALHTVAKHLKPGGLFIFDIWYGPAVLKIRPNDRVKVIKLDDGQIIRAASGSLDPFNHQAEVNYRLWRIRNAEVVSEANESHVMRYFFPQELAFFLSQSGMSLKTLTAFPDLVKPASEESWNALGVAGN